MPGSKFNAQQHMNLPLDHPQRFELNDEVHARPPEALDAPIAAIVPRAVSDCDTRSETHWSAELAARYGAPPKAECQSLQRDLGAFRHQVGAAHRVHALQVHCAGRRQAHSTTPRSLRCPRVGRQLPAKLIVAAHAMLLPAGTTAPDLTPSPGAVRRQPLVGARIAAAPAMPSPTSASMATVSAGCWCRTPAWPPAGRAHDPAAAGNRHLPHAGVARATGGAWLAPSRPATSASSRRSRPAWRRRTKGRTQLLDRLTRLDADIEKRHAESHYRFTAAAAYHELVQRRIAELREERIEGLQTFREFVERRLARRPLDLPAHVRAAGVAFGTRRAGEPTAVDPRRHRPPAAEPGGAGIDEPTRQAAAAPAGGGGIGLRLGKSETAGAGRSDCIESSSSRRAGLPMVSPMGRPPLAW